MKPGDRKYRWRQANAIEASIFFAMTAGLVYGVVTASTLGQSAATSLLAIVCLGMGALAVRDYRRGWHMRDERPPWADKHDTINARGAEETSAIKGRHRSRKKYAFDK